MDINPLTMIQQLISLWAYFATIPDAVSGTTPAESAARVRCKGGFPGFSVKQRGYIMITRTTLVWSSLTTRRYEWNDSVGDWTSTTVETGRELVKADARTNILALPMDKEELEELHFATAEEELGELL